MFVWFWLVFVLVVTIVNFLIWCRHIFSGEQRKESIAKYLRIFGYHDDDNVSSKEMKIIATAFLATSTILKLRGVSNG